jgi:hypothetical protein
VIPRKHWSQQYYKRIVDSVWLSLYMRDNENVQNPSRPLAPTWAVLESGLNFQHLIVLASMIPKDQKKYNNTEVKYRATFNSCHTALHTCYCVNLRSSFPCASPFFISSINGNLSKNHRRSLSQLDSFLTWRYEYGKRWGEMIRSQRI